MLTREVFQAHGESDVWRKDSILYANLKGSWNKEAALEFSESFKRVAEPLTAHPWGHLVYLHEWDLCAPDVFPVIENLVAWCLDHNLVRAAQIYPPSIMKKQFIDQMVVEEMGNFRRATFDNKDDAYQWLVDEMAKIQ